MTTKRLQIFTGQDGNIYGLDAETGNIYSPPASQMGWLPFDQLIKGVANTTTKVAETVAKPTAWQKIGNVASNAGKALLNPNTAAGGLVYSGLNNLAANLAAGNLQIGAGYNPYGVDPLQAGFDDGGDNGDMRKYLMIGGGALALVLIIALIKK